MAYILSLATATPSYRFEQSAIASEMLKSLRLSPEQEKALVELYARSGIQSRYSVMHNFDLLFTSPTSRERNAIYKQEAPKLALEAAKKAIAKWKGDPKTLTHVISVSCTGMMAPGIECLLIQELSLNSSVGRFGINFMGCFGAFNGLSLAKALSKENPHNRILLVCTELCSLHAQVDHTADTFLANALFADGAAACIVSGERADTTLWEIIERSTFFLPDTLHLMTWEAADSGYAMTLSSKVPVCIRKNILPFAKALVQKHVTFEECQWAIHPGGKSILKAVEKACALHAWQTENSWEILKNYGNMSSATFLFVLEKSLQNQARWTIGMAFGPGLTIEGILLRR